VSGHFRNAGLVSNERFTSQTCLSDNDAKAGVCELLDESQKRPSPDRKQFSRLVRPYMGQIPAIS
jgi:hypothetical protein